MQSHTKEKEEASTMKIAVQNEYVPSEYKTRQYNSSSWRMPTPPLLQLASILHRSAVILLCLDLCRMLNANEAGVDYWVDGAYVTAAFLYVVCLETAFDPQMAAKIWDNCLVLLLFLRFVAPLWLTYYAFATNLVFRHISLGLEARRWIRDQEALNRKKVDDNDLLVYIESSEGPPKDDVALNILREREAHIRTERKRQIFAIQSCYRAGVDPKEAMSLSVV